MIVSQNEKFLAYLALFAGLLISLVAEYYSILGLTSIFSAAMIPVIIMGVALGIGKITATLWLKQNWKICPWSVKVYLIAAIVTLMLMTSMGIFGFLSKAHSDQNLVSGDVQSKIAIYDEKIKTSQDNIDVNRKALKQLDEAVDQVMGRSTSEAGADKAVAIRRSQANDRKRLLAEIQTEQKTIAKLNEEAAPIRAEVRKVEAKVGPIKYIAALVYGDNPDENLLERSVRWVIILIVVVFDPLALVLLLASQISFKHFRDNSEPVTVNNTADSVNVTTDNDVAKDHTVNVEQASTDASVDAKEPDDDILKKHPYLTAGFKHFENIDPIVYKPQVKAPVLKEADNNGLFVQNEEQTQSNLWTNTVNNINQEDYNRIARERLINDYADQVRNKQLSIGDVPEDFQAIIRSKV